MSNIAKKITVKTVMGDPKNVIKDRQDGEQVVLMRVYGMANEFKAKNSDYGDYILFNGQFEAQNMLTGEVFQSGNLILPPVAEGPLHGILENTEATSVQFAYEISLKVDTSLARDYEFKVRSLLDSGQEDPLSQLREQVKPALEGAQNTGETQNTGQKKQSKQGQDTAQGQK